MMTLKIDAASLFLIMISIHALYHVNMMTLKIDAASLFLIKIIYIYIYTVWGKKKYDSLIYYNLKSKRAITLK